MSTFSFFAVGSRHASPNNIREGIAQDETRRDETRRTERRAPRKVLVSRYPVRIFLLCTAHSGASLYVHSLHIQLHQASDPPSCAPSAVAPDLRRGVLSLGRTKGPRGGDGLVGLGDELPPAASAFSLDRRNITAMR